MPFLSIPETSRRGFLRALAGGALLWRGGARAADGSVTWALASDTHIPEDPETMSRGFHIHGNMRRVLSEVGRARVSGLAITGDLARTEGREGDYRTLRGLLEPAGRKMPVVLALGNHDDRANFRKVFHEHPGKAAPVKGKHVLVIETPVVRMLALDSMMYVNRTAGLLGKAQRTWLEEYLRNTADDLPTVLLMHHTLEDHDRALLDGDRLMDIVRPHRNVKGIVYGHSHRYEYKERDGVQMINLPAVAFHFSPEQPVGWVEAKFTREGAAMTLHAVAGDRSADGKTVAVRWR
jgi:Icc protein